MREKQIWLCEALADVQYLPLDCDDEYQPKTVAVLGYKKGRLVQGLELTWEEQQNALGYTPGELYEFDGLHVFRLVTEKPMKRNSRLKAIEKAEKVERISRLKKWERGLCTLDEWAELKQFSGIPVD